MKVTLNPFKSRSTQHAVAVFDNPGSFVATLDRMSGKDKTARQMGKGDRFYSGQSWQDMTHGAVHGDKDSAARAAKLMREIESVAYETPKRKRVASPFGRVSVGAYLASDPLPCRRHVKAASNAAPLSIVVSLNSLADVRASDLEKRGVAIAALVRRLVKERPVSLYLSRFSDCGGVASCMLVRFPTTPLDSHRLAYLLSSQGFARGAGFAFHRSAKDVYGTAGTTVKDVATSDMISFHGTTAYSQSRNCQFAKDLQQFLGTELLYIPGSDSSAKEFSLMVKNPVKWINDTMASLTNGNPA